MWLSLLRSRFGFPWGGSRWNSLPCCWTFSHWYKSGRYCCFVMFWEILLLGWWGRETIILVCYFTQPGWRSSKWWLQFLITFGGVPSSPAQALTLGNSPAVKGPCWDPQGLQAFPSQVLPLSGVYQGGFWSVLTRWSLYSLEFFLTPFSSQSFPSTNSFITLSHSLYRNSSWAASTLWNFCIRSSLAWPPSVSPVAMRTVLVEILAWFLYLLTCSLSEHGFTPSSFCSRECV